MPKERKTPKIRFPGFTDDWEQRKLGDIATFVNGRAYSQDELLDSGKYKVLRVGNFYTNDSWYFSDLELDDKYYAEEGDLLYTWSATFGPHIWRGDKVIYHYHIWKVELSESLEKLFAVQLLEQDKASILSNKNGSTMVHITKAGMEEKSVIIPKDVREQRKIGLFFETLDNTIALHQRKCDEMKQLKQAMLQKMFPKDGEKTPEIRFPGFTEDWEQRKLDDLCSLVTKQTGFDYSSTIKPALVNEHLEGTLPFIQNKDFSGNEINMDTDFYIPEEVVKRYPKITLDQPCLLISISGKIGNVGLYKRSERAFIGGAVGICRLLDDTNGEFIMQELLSDKGQHYFQSLIKASSHQNITVEDIRKIEILMPSASEQEKISTFFEALDNLITLHQRKCDEMKQLKQAMLQKMFI